MFEKPTLQQLQNRYSFHPAKGDQGMRYDLIRNACLGLAQFIVDSTPCCPEQSRALNALDEVMFLANAAIARNEQ